MRIGLELLVGYGALFLLTKILGKSQITQITAFDFISALVLGELVGNALFDDNIGISKILFAIFLWGLLIYATEMVTQKYKGTRKFLEGSPSIVINKGKINYEEMKKNRLDINQLQLLLRKKEIFSIRECEYGILETDGTISVLKKPVYDTPSIGDLNLPIKSVNLPVTLVMDGEIIYDNMHLIHWDEKQLENQLKMNGYSSVKDVLYAEWQEGEAIHVQSY